MTKLEQELETEYESRMTVIKNSVITRLSWTPFEIGLALFSIYSGVSGLFNFGASNILFQAAIKGASIYNIIFILAGASVIYGLAMVKANVEAFGLCCIISSLIVRMLAIIATTGWNEVSHNLLAISLIFVLCSVARLGAIINGSLVPRS